MSAPSSLFKHVKECLAGFELHESLDELSEAHYKKKSFKFEPGNVSSLDTQGGQYSKEVISAVITLYFKTTKFNDLMSAWDEAEALRLKVASHILAKKHGITLISIDDLLPSSEGGSPMQRTFQFTVNATMNFDLP